MASRARKEAAVRALGALYGVDLKQAGIVVEGNGLRRTARVLEAAGLHYHADRRAWLMDATAEMAAIRTR